MEASLTVFTSGLLLEGKSVEQARGQLVQVLNRFVEGLAVLAVTVRSVLQQRRTLQTQQKQNFRIPLKAMLIAA